MTTLYEAAADESFAVIGGEGFVGQAIVQGLQAAYPNHPIASFGLTQRTFTPNYRFFRTDITSLLSVVAALKASGATTIFHTASPHATGSAADCERVNVVGTQAAVDACREVGVKKLVYTSSVTVVYRGTNLTNVDERLPVAAVEEFDDPYVTTKIAAEKIVLEANGKDGLLTCSLRLCGIFGPGDRQAIPGFIDVYHNRQTSFQIGHNTNLFDWVHVSNVVHAHILAASRLSPSSSHTVTPETFSTRLAPVQSTIVRRSLPTSKSPEEPPDPPLPAHRVKFNQYAPPIPDSATRVDGEVFYITNGEPIPFWTFARAVWWEYAHHVPPFVIPLPVSVGLGLANLLDLFVAGVLRATGKDLHLALSVKHVQYVVSDMYCDIEKARRVLGYEPIISLQDGIKDAVRWAKEDEAIRKQKK